MGLWSGVENGSKRVNALREFPTFKPCGDWRLFGSISIVCYESRTTFLGLWLESKVQVGCRSQFGRLWLPWLGI